METADVPPSDGDFIRRIKLGKESEKFSLFRSYFGVWLKSIAKKYYLEYKYLNLEPDDFYHTLMLAAFDLIEKYDDSKGKSFKGYAYKRLKGEIIELLRSTKDMNEYVISENDNEGFYGYFGRLATGKLIEEVFHDDDCYEDFEKQRLRRVLGLIIGKLNFHEKMVVQYHFFSGMKFVDIAELMGVTRGRVSQIYSMALKKIGSSILNENIDV